MAIPDYQSIMLPLLRLAADGDEHRFRESVRVLADQHALTSEERDQLIPSGTQPVFVNRVGWARTYLVKAGLLESPRRGYFRITERGRSVLSKPPAILNTAFLKATYSEVRDFEAKIVLIDGARLARYMFEHNVGVEPESVYEIKKVDIDFFEEDETT